jgi:hypothetical protein
VSKLDAGLANEILPVTCILRGLGEPQKLLGIDEAQGESDFPGARNFQPCKSLIEFGENYCDENQQII